MIDRLVIIAFVALLGVSLAVAAALLRARTEAARLLGRNVPDLQSLGEASPAAQAPDTAATLILTIPRPAATPSAATTPASLSASISDLSAADDPSASVDWLAQAVDELRTPLDILRGQVEALRHAAPDGPRQTLVALTGRLVEQVEQAQELVAAWSASIRGTTPPRATSHDTAVDIVALARRVSADHEGSACDVARTPPVWAKLDPAPLARALAVAMQNARSADLDGVVEVVARVVGRDPDQRIGITIADRRSAQVSPSARLWDDLELDLVRTLLEDCGGWVECEPRGGGGRLVTFWLPGALLCEADMRTALPRSA